MRLSVEEVMRILFETDPMKLHSPKQDEYAPEASTLAPILDENDSEDGVLGKLCDVLETYFDYGTDLDGTQVYFGGMVGDRENYRPIAKAIHTAMNSIQQVKSNGESN